MKRKSIFFTIVALLISGFAVKAQQVPLTPPTKDHWWDGNAWIQLNTLNTGLKTSDTIIFCSTLDSLYPVELGYDISNRKLSPQYGDWTLIAVTQPSATAADYQFGTAGNNGAGNAFKVVTSGVGGYVFQYLSNNSQCGLNPGEKYWVYVFILPDLSSAITKDTTVCPSNTPHTVNAAQHFTNSANTVNYDMLYKQAGLNLSWTLPSSANIKIDKVGIDTTVYFKFSIAPDPKYKCGLSDSLKYHVMVDSLNNLQYISKAICPQDTAGNPFVATLFGRTVPGFYGSLAVPIVRFRDIPSASWTPTPVIGGGTGRKAAVTFNYTNCNGQSATVSDTLVLRDSPTTKYWGIDTAVQCRQPGVSYDLFSVYGNPNGKPTLTSTNAMWAELGSMQNGSLGNPPAGSFLPPSTVVGDALNASVGYHYQWKIDGGANCFAGDSGRLVLILQDPFTLSDYRAQVCQKVPSVNLAEFTGVVGATYTSPTTGSGINGETLTIGTLTGTHVITVDKAAGAGSCGTASTSKLYLKITNSIKVPTAHTIKFCVSKLPKAINLFEVAGFYETSAGSWGVATPGGTGTSNVPTIPATGSIDVGSWNPSPGTYIFNYNGTGTNSCVNKNITVTIDIVTAL
ncbi:MAG: hypothetical protein LBG92_00145 [Prevotellaceae bacterium]|jgi:hypothetical protein|nr:hypothetical protein [Prevotellaceae bacterium]